VLIELGSADLGVARQVAKLPELPAALTVRGRDRARNTAEVQRCFARLRARGLMDPRGVLSADLHRAIDAFANAAFEIDLRVVGGRCPEVRAVLTGDDRTAMLAVVTGGHVRFSRVPAEAGLPALIGVLPPVDAARGLPVSLPLAIVDEAITTAMDQGRSGDDGVATALAARGVAADDAALFTDLVPARRIRTAEFGVTVRDRAGVRRRSGRTVHTVDTRRGRAVRHTRGDYLVVEPASPETIARVLAEHRDTELCRVERPRSA
jgi:EspG family